jgi:hypothetical protein
MNPISVTDCHLVQRLGAGRPGLLPHPMGRQRGDRDSGADHCRHLYGPHTAVRLLPKKNITSLAWRYRPALSQTGRWDPQTSGKQIQKAIDSAVNMTALWARWPVVLAKAQLLLLNSSGIENYCRKPFGGRAGPIARWQDSCANVPQADRFP